MKPSEKNVQWTVQVPNTNESSMKSCFHFFYPRAWMVECTRIKRKMFVTKKNSLPTFELLGFPYSKSDWTFLTIYCITKLPMH